MPLRYVNTFENNYIPALNLEQVLPALERKQLKHDKTIAEYNANIQNDLAQGYFDKGARDAYLQEQQQNFNTVVEKNRGNLARGYKDVVETITTSKAHPWHRLNQYQVEQAKLESDLMNQYGDRALSFSGGKPRGSVVENPLLNPETGEWTDFEPITADVRLADEYDKNFEEQVKQLSPDLDAYLSGLFKPSGQFGEGMLGDTRTTVEQLDEKLDNFLNTPEVYQGFIANNETARYDYRDSGMTDAQGNPLSYQQIFEDPTLWKQWAKGQIEDKRLRRVNKDAQYRQAPREDTGGRGGGGLDTKNLVGAANVIAPQVTMETSMTALADKMTVGQYSPDNTAYGSYVSGTTPGPGTQSSQKDTPTTMYDKLNPDEKKTIGNVASFMGLKQEDITKPDNWNNIQSYLKNITDQLVNTPIVSGVENFGGALVGIPDVSFPNALASHTGALGFTEDTFGSATVEFNDKDEPILKKASAINHNFISPDGKVLSGEQFVEHIKDNKSKYEGQGLVIAGTVSPENHYITLAGDDKDFLTPYQVVVGDEQWIMSNPDGITVQDKLTGQRAYTYNDPNNIANNKINELYRLQTKPDPKATVSLADGFQYDISYVSPNLAQGVQSGYYIETPNGPQYISNSATDVWNVLLNHYQTNNSKAE